MLFDRAVVDSSVFVAFYWAKDTQHTEALRVMEELASARLVVHPYVIQEVATVLTQKLGLLVAKKFLADISSSSNVEIVWVDVKADVDAFVRTSTPISFTDVALVRLAKSDDIRLFTFDRKLLSLFKNS